MTLNSQLPQIQISELDKYFEIKQNEMYIHLARMLDVRIDRLKGEIEAFKQALSSIETSFDLSPQSKRKGKAPEPNIYSTREIRALILEHGHKIKMFGPFTSKYYARALSQHVELRDGDEECAKGRAATTVFQHQVGDAMLTWIRGDMEGRVYYRGCPFERCARQEYTIKEGYQWPKQTA